MPSKTDLMLRSARRARLEARATVMQRLIVPVRRFFDGLNRGKHFHSDLTIPAPGGSG
jgi:hypothetical protein